MKRLTTDDLRDGVTTMLDILRSRKMKQIHKEKLASELVKYCKQIGVLDNEIPRLIFDPTVYRDSEGPPY